MSPKETAELEKKTAKKKTASPKKEATKKSTARKAVKADTNEPKAAKAAAKKAPARKTAAKKTVKKAAAKKEVPAAPAQSQAAAREQMKTIDETVKLGTDIAQDLEAAKTAAPKADAAATDEKAAAMASRKELADKSAAENNVQKNLSARSEADAKIAAKGYKKPARKKAKKNAVNQTKAAAAADTSRIAAEAKDGARIYAGIKEVKGMDYADVVAAAKADAANQARAALTAKAFGASVQNNLTARSQAALKAFNLEESHQSKEEMDARLDVIGTEDKDGAKIFNSIENMKDAPYESAAPAAKSAENAVPAKKAKPAKTKASAKSSKAAEEAAVLEGSHQSKQEMDAHLDVIGTETKDGAEIFNSIENMKDAPYEKVAPAMASRIELARKSAAENNTQTNLSARSAADAKLAAKGYKKPARRKASSAQSKEAQEKIVSQILAEVKDGGRLFRLIKEVPGTPYEEVVKAVEEKAAMESRKKLAAKTRPALGAGTAKSASDEENAFYSSLDDQTLLEMAQAVGLDMDYDTLKKELELSPDIDAQTQKYLEDAARSGKKFTFEKDGFDERVIPFLTKKIAATLPNKEKDNVEFARKATADINRMLINDSANDTAIYNDLFADVKHVLMYAQQNGLYTLEDVEKAIPADLAKLIDRFMTVAYTILPGWQYNDVKYYEGFLYSVMAQFDDLADQQNRALMDIADLYIKHGDYQKGNDGYGYVLRENQLKDQIYYRFAKVYEPFDLQRAKGIASDALRIIDGRYTYYPQILEILQK